MRKMWTMLLPQFMRKMYVTKNIADCDWVKIIYHKMGGHVSLIPQDCCRMNGVACFDGHVVHITWVFQGLNGYIPPEIGNLVNLRWL